MPPRPVPQPRVFFARDAQDADFAWYSPGLRPLEELLEELGVQPGSEEATHVYGLRKAAEQLAGYARHVETYLRTERLSQRQLAQSVGVKQQSLSDFLLGKQWPRTHNLLRLLEATEATLRLEPHGAPTTTTDTSR